MLWRGGSISASKPRTPQSPWQGGRSEVPPVNLCRAEPSSVLFPGALHCCFICLFSSCYFGRVKTGIVLQRQKYYFISARPRLPAQSCYVVCSPVALPVSPCIPIQNTEQRTSTSSREAVVANVNSASASKRHRREELRLSPGLTQPTAEEFALVKPPCRYGGSAVELLFTRMSICRTSHAWDASNILSVVTLGSAPTLHGVCISVWCKVGCQA